MVDNQIEPALTALKPEMVNAGLLEMKRRAYDEQPSVKRKRKQVEAGKKRRKAVAQRVSPPSTRGDAPSHSRSSSGI